jgi:hypothetical protein
VLKRAVWWYVGASKQAGGTDAAIIIAQAGLELLAWVNLVEKEKLISQRGYDDLPAADKLRLFIATMKVSMDFPDELDALKSLAEEQEWAVAPWALTEVRNRLVHPKNRDELDGRPHAINDAYKLGMHYLELAILYSCGYDGEYSNRFTRKHSRDAACVPWAK